MFIFMIVRAVLMALVYIVAAGIKLAALIIKGIVLGIRAIITHFTE